MADPNDVASILQKLAPGVVPNLIRDAMVAGGYVKDPRTGAFAPVKSEVLRQRTREWLMEQLHGKPRQRELDNREAPPERDEDLLVDLATIIKGARLRVTLAAEKAKAREEKEAEAKRQPVVVQAAMGGSK